MSDMKVRAPTVVGSKGGEWGLVHLSAQEESRLHEM
jgi:hypothetical protein